MAYGVMAETNSGGRWGTPPVGIQKSYTTYIVMAYGVMAEINSGGRWGTPPVGTKLVVVYLVMVGRFMAYAVMAGTDSGEIAGGPGVWL